MAPVAVVVVRLLLLFGIDWTELGWNAGSTFPELSYLATAVPLVSLAMAATAPFALFRRLRLTHAAVETRVGSTSTSTSTGAGDPAVGAAGDWSGPMLPAEVRRPSRVFVFFGCHVVG